MIDDDAERGIGTPREVTLDETTGVRLKRKATKLSETIVSMAGQTATLVGDLNGDGKVDGQDAKIARDRAVATLSTATEEAGRLAKSVARTPLIKDVAAYAAIGAAIALPLPIVGPAIGAAVGAGLGLFRNLKRNDTMPQASPGAAALPTDPMAELERLHGLKEKGIVTEEEFLAQKRKILR